MTWPASRLARSKALRETARAFCIADQETEPAELESTVNQIPGVVTNGLFARRGADILLLGTAAGVETLRRAG